MKCKILQYKNDGFTFLETVISLSIVLIVITGLTSFILSFNNNRKTDFIKPQIEVLKFNDSIRKIINLYNFDPDIDQNIIYNKLEKKIYEEAELYKYIKIEKISYKNSIYNSSNNNITLNKKLIEVQFNCCNHNFCIQESLF